MKNIEKNCRVEENSNTQFFTDVEFLDSNKYIRINPKIKLHLEKLILQKLHFYHQTPKA